MGRFVDLRVAWSVRSGGDELNVFVVWLVKLWLVVMIAYQMVLQCACE